MIYLLRVNLDIEAKNPVDSPRFQAAVSTVSSLIKKGNKVVIMSHYDRPKKYDSKLSLARFQPFLQRELGKTVVFFPKFDFARIKREIKASKNSIFLLDNLRFLPGEVTNDKATAAELASLGDRYINDDFATSHRDAASIVGITKLLPSSAGPTLLREVSQLEKVIKHPKRPITLIVGGGKMKDKLGIIQHLIKRIDYVLVGGGPANNFFLAQGQDIKKSICEPEMLPEVKKLMKSKKVIVPVDSAWGKDAILDIGPKTIKQYSAIIKKSKTVIWGGPMGLFEKKEFAKGSYAVARAIVDSHAFSIVGGEETGMVINQLKLKDKISLLSTGGGSMLAFLSGERLAGLDALKIKY